MEKKGEKKSWWTLNLSPSSRWMKKELQKLKAETGRNQYELGEEALRQYLREKKKEIKRHNNLALTKREAREVIKIILRVQEIIEYLEEDRVPEWYDLSQMVNGRGEYKAIPVDWWENKMGGKFPLSFQMRWLNEAIKAEVGDTPYYLREKKKLFFTRRINGETIGMLPEKEEFESYSDFMTGQGRKSQNKIKVRLNVGVVRTILRKFKLGI